MLVMALNQSHIAPLLNLHKTLGKSGEVLSYSGHANKDKDGIVV